MALHSFIPLDIGQPQREGDGRQALVVPPLYPAPATSLKSRSPLIIFFLTKSALNVCAGMNTARYESSKYLSAVIDGEQSSPGQPRAAVPTWFCID